VPTAHHGRRPIAMPTAKPVPTVIWPVPTPAYADGDVPTVAVGTVPTAFLAVPTATGRRHLVCVP
jgi:hypothetical protein